MPEGLKADVEETVRKGQPPGRSRTEAEVQRMPWALDCETSGGWEQRSRSAGEQRTAPTLQRQLMQQTFARLTDYNPQAQCLMAAIETTDTASEKQQTWLTTRRSPRRSFA